MRNRRVSVGLAAGGAFAVYAAIAALDPAAARASEEIIAWTQDVHIPGFSGGPGCANQIAVGPNNVPIVLGCSGPDGVNRWLFQLVYSSGTYTWVNSGAAGVSIAVDATSVPWLLTNDGHIWASESIFGNHAWVDVTALNTQDGSPFGAGRLSHIAVVTTGTPGVDTIWGLGYSPAANNTVWDASYDIPIGGAWSQVDAQDGADGSKLVVFTGTLLGQQYQIPAVINTGGNIYLYSASTTKFVQIAAAPILDVADGWVIANISGVPTLFQFVPLGLDWTEWPSSLNSPNGTSIVRIAYAGLGPSALWGLDTSGHIFTSNPSLPSRL
jgi:hypothetical protein